MMVNTYNTYFTSMAMTYSFIIRITKITFFTIYKKFIDINIIFRIIFFTKTNIKTIIKDTKIIKKIVQEMKL